jgi:hypothetical protein
MLRDARHYCSIPFPAHHPKSLLNLPIPGRGLRLDAKFLRHIREILVNPTVVLQSETPFWPLSLRLFAITNEQYEQATAAAV